MRRSSLRRKSDHQRKIEVCDALLRKILIELHGWKCQICGRQQVGRNLTVFHILPKGKYPKLRFRRENVLLACWFPCHDRWHHDFYYAREIEKSIKTLLGDDYHERLVALDAMATKISAFYLDAYERVLREELDSLEKEKRSWQVSTPPVEPMVGKTVRAKKNKKVSSLPEKTDPLED